MGFALYAYLGAAPADLVCRTRAVMGLKRFERPVGVHQHVNRAVLTNENGEGSGFELRAVSRGRGFEDALGVSEQIRHKALIEPLRTILNYPRRYLLKKSSVRCQASLAAASS